MKFLPLLLLLASVRTCTKESSAPSQKAAQVPVEIVDEIRTPDHSTKAAPDSVTVSILGIYLDDVRTRGSISDEGSRINNYMVQPEFYDRFNYPELARRNDIEGSCTVQFAIDSASKICFFSVLKTDSKIFSDDVRQVIVSSPITVVPFPGNRILRFEVKVDYRRKVESKM